MRSNPEFAIEAFNSPIGGILLVSSGGQVRALDFADYETRLHKLLAVHWGTPVLRSVTQASEFRRRMEDYFAGDLAAIDAVPVAAGGTDFQQSIWRGLRQIPAGLTWTYGQLASHIGRPKAVRAAGLANSLNPVSIIVPCHRVIGANASLTGYAGGLERKQWLLRHEGARLV